MTHRVTITTENVHEPETFVQVTPKFSDGFLVLEGPWDTYMIRTSIINEIRIIKEDYSMTLNYTPVEFKDGIKKKRVRIDNTKRDLIIRTATDAINSLEEYVDFPDDPEAINKAEDVLEGFKFHRVGDVDRDGNCRYKIVADV